ncbi:uncharacterized protein MELLADRAFT_106268 [Melampsora larici-populina 98AG31]|uniref:La-related protein 7 homolog xRRM domain-containing protein n=1 Tax=Melampsora larici-populina (strain 98AG31 / pathotype 3-4-7) TaxID=747676 RepID=F4RKU2_MELLP|nr:uncharacterized protein MELLADRAFT_106268 [Melampsora larici-populina 98AG31]EGG06977.1 hypothetical protein MELLADRAFT_106268 [Melampsora larici-populina 98AG31]
MASLVPRAVALRQKAKNQKNSSTIISNSQQNVDRPCLDRLPLSTDVSTLAGAFEPIKSVQIEVNVQIETGISSEQSTGSRNTTQFKNETTYSSRANRPLQSDQQVYPRSIYKSSRTYPSGYYDQKRVKENLFPIGCIVWLTGLPEVRFNKLQVLELISIILKIGKTNDDILLGDSISEKKINDLVKYVDLQKGLDNCHIRLCNNKTSQKFLSCLNQFLKTNCSHVLLEKDETVYNFSRLKGTILSGRREEIYWEKIPLYLYY